jgi:hypothetical protein
MFLKYLLFVILSHKFLTHDVKQGYHFYHIRLFRDGTCNILSLSSVGLSMLMNVLFTLV